MESAFVGIDGPDHQGFLTDPGYYYLVKTSRQTP